MRENSYVRIPDAYPAVLPGMELFYSGRSTLSVTIFLKAKRKARNTVN